jgi:hypothetical protein
MYIRISVNSMEETRIAKVVMRGGIRVARLPLALPLSDDRGWEREHNDLVATTIA